MTRLGHNTIAKLERDETRSVQPWTLGRIVPFLAGRFKEAFPEAKGDAYDYLIPPKTFGDWMRNFRLRRGLQQIQLARAIRVNKFSVNRYEMNQSRPNTEVLGRIRRRFGLNGELDRFFRDRFKSK